MSRNAAPLFVEERKYRRRRLGDAARLLPVVGAVLLILPLLWARGDGSAIARETLYLFAVWAGLILCVGLLSRALVLQERRAQSRAEGASSAPASAAPAVAAPEPGATVAPPGKQRPPRPADQSPLETTGSPDQAHHRPGTRPDGSAPR